MFFKKLVYWYLKLIMKDYKVELYGWECHIKAKNISGDDFDMDVKFDDPHEVE